MSYLLIGAFQTFFLSWKLFSESTKDNTDLFLISKDIKRTQIFKNKILLIYLSSLVNMSVYAFLLAIIIPILSLPSIYILLYSLAWLFSSAIGIILVLLLAVYINVYLARMSALVTSIFTATLIVSLSVVQPLFLKGESNVLKWDKEKYKVNYGKVIQIDKDDGHFIQESTFSYLNPSTRQLQNNSVKLEKNINSKSSYGLVVDKLFGNWHSLFSYGIVSSNQRNLIKLANDGAFSTVYVNDYESSKRFSNNRRSLIYRINDDNPIQKSYNEVLTYYIDNLVKIEKEFERNPSSINSFDSIENLWQTIKDRVVILEDIEIFRVKANRDIIQNMIGFNENNHLTYYLFRDFNVLNTKYKSLFDDIERYNGLKTSTKQLSKKLFTDSFWRLSLITDNGNIFGTGNIDDIYPTIYSTVISLDANSADIRALKDAVSDIDVTSGKIRILSTINGTNSKQYQTIENFTKFDNTKTINSITTKKQWDELIEQNKSYKSLEAINAELQRWASNQGVSYAYSLTPNTTEVESLSSLIDLKKEYNISAFFIILFIYLSSVVTLYFYSNRKYKRKDIIYN